MVVMEEHGEIIDSSSSSNSSTEESDNEVQSNPEEVTTRSPTPTSVPVARTPIPTPRVVVGSHMVEIPNLNVPVVGTPVLGLPFTQFQQARPFFVEISNPNVGLISVNQTQQAVNGVENLGNYFPQIPQPTLAARRQQLAEAVRRTALATRAMYPLNPPITTENNNNGAPTTWPPWISNQNFHCSARPHVGCNEQCCAAFSFAQTTVPIANHHATAYLPMMPYQMEQPMPQPYMMGQNTVNPTPDQVEASASRPTTRGIRNSVYDPAYERMGLPVDPHLRAFLASAFNNNNNANDSNSATTSISRW